MMGEKQKYDKDGWFATSRKKQSPIPLNKLTKAGIMSDYAN